MILTRIATVYPKSFELTKDRVKVWREFMEQIDFDLAMKRLNSHIAKEDFAPTIAKILNPDNAPKKKKTEEPDTLSPAALMHGGYITLM